MSSRVSLLLEKPLAQVLLVARLRPVVVIYVEHFLLCLPLFLGRRDFRRFLPLCWLRLLRDGGAFEMEGLIVRLSLLSRPDAEIANISDVSLDPIEVFADEVFFALAIVAQDHISEAALPDKVSHLLDAVLLQVEISEVVFDGEILIEKRVIILDQIHSRPQDVPQKLLSQDQRCRELYLINYGERTFPRKLISPISIFSNRLLRLRSFFLPHLSSQVGLVLSSGPANEFLLFDFKVEEGERTNCLSPIFSLLEVKAEPIYKERSAGAVGHESSEMGNDFPKREFLAVLGGDELLLDGGDVRLVLNVPVANLRANILGCACFSRAGSASDDQVFSKTPYLILEGNVVLDLLSAEGLEEVDGAVEALAELVVVGFHAVREELELASVAFELVELFGLPRVVGEEDLGAVQVLEDNVGEDFEFIGVGLGLGGLLAEDGLDVEDVEQQATALLDVLLHDLPLLILVDVDIDQLGEQLRPDLLDHSADLLLARDAEEVVLLFEEGHEDCLLVEEGLVTGEFGALVLQVDDFEVEVGLEDGDLAEFGGEVDEEVVVGLGVLADEVVGSGVVGEQPVADEVEVVAGQ